MSFLLVFRPCKYILQFAKKKILAELPVIKNKRRSAPPLCPNALRMWAFANPLPFCPVSFLGALAAACWFLLLLCVCHIPPCFVFLPDLRPLRTAPSDRGSTGTSRVYHRIFAFAPKYYNGNVNNNSSPFCLLFCANIFPPCHWTAFFTIARPSPEPPVSRVRPSDAR